MTDQLAQELFKASLPKEWVAREQRPDYGIDYLVEVFEAGRFPNAVEPSGLIWAVQLKGRIAPQITKEWVRFPIHTDHLKYYVDRCRQPVFLVVIDVRHKVGYWLFLQGYVFDVLKRSQWRTKATLTLLIPKSNRLSATDHLKKAIREADKRMAELHPAAIQGALKGERERLESLDPRLRIEVIAKEGNINHIVHAREPFEFTMRFIGQRRSVLKKARDLVGRGLPVEFGPGEVEFAGSPLLESMSGLAGIVEFHREVDCTLDLVARDERNADKARVQGIPARLGGGTEEIRINGQLPKSPLVVRMKIKESVIGKGGPLKAIISLRLEHWAGQPIPSLAYWDSIAPFVSAVGEGSLLVIEIRKDGNRIFHSRPIVFEKHEFSQLALLIDLLRVARLLANRFHVAPICPSQWGEREAEQIRELQSFCEKLDGPRPVKGGVVTLTLHPESKQKLVSMVAEDNSKEGSTLELSTDGAQFQLFGETIKVGPHKHEFTYFRWLTTPEEIAAAIDGSPNGAIEVKLESTEQSTVRIAMLEC